MWITLLLRHPLQWLQPTVNIPHVNSYSEWSLCQKVLVQIGCFIFETWQIIARLVFSRLFLEHVSLSPHTSPCTPPACRIPWSRHSRKCRLFDLPHGDSSSMLALSRVWEILRCRNWLRLFDPAPPKCMSLGSTTCVTLSRIECFLWNILLKVYDTWLETWKSYLPNHTVHFYVSLSLPSVQKNDCFFLFKNFMWWQKG